MTEQDTSDRRDGTRLDDDRVPDETLQCPRCGFQGSPLAFEHKRVAPFVRQAFCTRCLEDSMRGRALRGAKQELLTPIVLAVVAALLGYFWGPELGWFLGFIAWTIALTVLFVVPHELGHVIAAKCTNFDLLEVQIGFGRRVWSGTAGGIRWSVNAYPVGGVTIACTRNLRVLRVRMIALSAGGPAANLLLLALSLGAQSIVDPQQYPVATAMIWGAFWANALLLALSLFPQRITTSVGPSASDGLSILRMLVARRRDLSRLGEAFYAMEWQFYTSERDHDRALGAVRHGLADYPESGALRSRLAISKLDTGGAREAREIFVELLASPECDALTRVYMKSNIAFCDFLLEERFAEADSLSREALEIIPWQTQFNATRGAVLIMLDRPGEALPALQLAMARSNDDDRMEIACLLAIAHSLLGNEDQVKKHLCIGSGLPEDNVLLARLRQMIA